MSTTPYTSSTRTFSDITKGLRVNLQTYALVIAMIVIWGFFFIWTDGAYLAPQNFSNLFRQMTVTALLSVGMVLVIVTGNIDLSVGKLAGFVSVVVAYLQARTWYEVLPDHELLTTTLSVILGLGVGTLYGIVQAISLHIWVSPLSS